MIKKTIVYLLLLIIAFVLFSGSAGAAGTAELTLSEGSIQPEGKIAVTLSIDKNPGMIYLAVSLNYGAGLTLVSAEDAGLMSVDSSVPENTGEIPYYIIWNAASAPKDIVNTGTLMTFAFMINDKASADNTQVNITFEEAYDYDLDPVSAADADTVIGINNPDTDTQGVSADADKAELEDMLTEGTALEKNDFTSESWKPYEELLIEAEAVAGDPDALPADIDRISEELNNAKDSLVNDINAETEPGTSENTSAGSDSEESVSDLPYNNHIIWIAAAAAAVATLCAVTVSLRKKYRK